MPAPTATSSGRKRSRLSASRLGNVGLTAKRWLRSVATAEERIHDAGPPVAMIKPTCPARLRGRLCGIWPSGPPVSNSVGAVRRYHGPVPRAIDFHVHLPTPDWLDGSMAGYVEAAEAYFRSPVQRATLDELADRYRRLDVMAVLLAWDAETASGRPRVPNSTVADACRAHPDAFTGIGSVDPHKESAVDEVAEIAALGLRGVKFHPSLQAFAPDDEKFWPVFAACESNGLLALFHTGTSGIGARQPGGQGIRIDYAHPLKLDSVA